MSKKVYALITGVVGGVATIASAVVTFCAPSYTPAIVAGIGVVATAICEVCQLFVKE